MTEIITFANQLGGVSFATLMMIIIYGGYKGVWVWGHQLAKVEQQLDWWRNIAVKATGIAEMQGHVLRVKEDKELAKVDIINRRLDQ